MKNLSNNQADAIQDLRALNALPPKFKIWSDLEQISVMEANSIGKVTDDELEGDFDLIRCESDNCLEELGALPSAMASVPPQQRFHWELQQPQPRCL